MALLAIVLVGVGFMDRPALSMKVTPHVCHAPCAVTITPRVTPHALNRWVVVLIDGPVSHTTRYQLDGELTGPLQPVEFRGLSEGVYVVAALLYRQTTPSEAAQVVQQVIVE